MEPVKHYCRVKTLKLKAHSRGKQWHLICSDDRKFSRQAMKAELLDAENRIATGPIAWRDHRDEAALHRLITAIHALGDFDGGQSSGRLMARR